MKAARLSSINAMGGSAVQRTHASGRASFDTVHVPRCISTDVILARASGMVLSDEYT